MGKNKKRKKLDFGSSMKPKIYEKERAKISSRPFSKSNKFTRYTKPDMGDK